MTILRMTKEDRRKVEEARTNATLWNSAKNIFSESLFFANKGKEIDYSKPNSIIFNKK